MPTPLTQHLVDTGGRLGASAGATYHFYKDGGWLYQEGGGVGLSLVAGNGNIQVFLRLYTTDDMVDRYSAFVMVGQDIETDDGAFDTPFAAGAGTARIEVGYPMRLMADITTWDKAADYTFWTEEDQTVARWGPMWQTEGEVPDLLPYTNADLSWWYWPYDEGGVFTPGAVRITVGGKTLLYCPSPETTPFPQAGGALSVGVSAGHTDFLNAQLGISAVVNNCGGCGLTPHSELWRFPEGDPRRNRWAMQIEQTDSALSVVPVCYDPDWDYASVESASVGITTSERFKALVTASVNSVTGTEWPDAADEPQAALKLLATDGPEREPPNGAGERDEGLRVAKSISGTSTEPEDSLDFLIPGTLDKSVAQYSSSVSLSHPSGPVGTMYWSDSGGRDLPVYRGLGWTQSLTHMANRGLDRNAFRALIEIPGLSWTQGAVYYGSPQEPIDSFTSTVEGWQAVAGEVLSVDAGKLKIVKAGAKAVTKVFLADAGTGAREVWFDTLSMLVISLTAPEGTTCTATLGGKTWEHTHDGEPWVIRLCIPDSAEGVDTSSSRYEREFANGAPCDSEGGWGWGIGRADQTLRLDFDTAQDVWLDSVSAYAPGSHQLITAQGIIVEDERFRVDDQTLFQTDLKRWAQPYLMHVVDGRVEAQEEAGILREPALAAYEDTYQTSEARTIDDVLSRLQLGDGFPVTQISGRRVTARASRGSGVVAVENAAPLEGTPAVNGGVTFWPQAQYCRGARMIWNLRPGHAAGASGSALTLTGHVVTDRIGVGFGVEVPLVSRLVLWGGVHGVVAEGDGPVTAVTGGVALDAAEISEPGRRFALPEMHMPWADVSAPWDVIRAGDETGGEWDKAIQGVLLRLCLLGGDEPPTGEDVDVRFDHMSGHGFIAYGTQEGLIKTTRSFDHGRSWTAPNTLPGVTGARRPSLITGKSHPQRAWGLTYDINGAASIAWSTDGFYNKDDTVLMTGVTHVRAVIHPISGVMLIAGFRIADKTIISAYSLDYGATLSAVTPVCEADEDAAFGLHYASDSQATWTITATCGGVVRTYWSTDNGANWEVAN